MQALETESSITHTGRAIVIHEDAFFLSKSACPLVTFTTTPADVPFVEQTLADDSVGTYIISWAGNRIGAHQNASKEINDSSKGDKDIDGVGQADGWKAVWKITGCDTDCWSALDIPTFITTIKEVRETGKCLSLTGRYAREATLLPGRLISAAEQKVILDDNADLVSEMKETVKNWTKEQAIANAECRFQGLNTQGVIETGTGKEALPRAMCLIEGFLLFLRPVTETPSSESSDSDKDNKLPVPQNNLGDEKGTPEERTAFDIHGTQVAAYGKINAVAKTNLMENFDIKLFLPTSKQQAKKRRFDRHPYIDAPNGERLPGQMWKTDGYFDDIAWGNHIKEHKWLMEDGNLEGSMESSAEAVRAGVHIRPKLDADLEDTVRWVVDVILGELGRKVCLPKSHVQVRYDTEYENKEVKYEDADGDDGPLQQKGKTAKKSKKKCGADQNQTLLPRNILTRFRNVLREKLSKIKRCVLDYIRIKEPKVERKDFGNIRGDSLASFFGKGKDSKSDNQLDVKGKGKQKKRDVGLKTIIESEKVDRGFFSPRQQYGAPTKW